MHAVFSGMLDDRTFKMAPCKVFTAVTHSEREKL